MTDSLVTAHVVVTDANGQSSDFRVTDFLSPGDLIHEQVFVVAARAAALAVLSLDLDGQVPFHRDYTDPTSWNYRKRYHR